MSTVTVTDSEQQTLTAEPMHPDPLSALVRYAQSPELNLVLLPDLVRALDTPLGKAAATPICFAMQVGQAYRFGAGEPQFSIGAGATAAVNVNAKKDNPLFSDNLYRSPIAVKDGEGYLSLALTGSVTGKGSQSESGITPGFQAGTTVVFEHFRRFPVSTRVRDALGAVIAGFVLPADIADLGALREGDIAVCTGKRTLKVSADVSVSASAVPLATPSLPLAVKPVRLNAGARFDVTAGFDITSGWQIRSRAIAAGVIELGVYKQEGSDWDLALTGCAGIDVTLGSTDLLTKLIDGLSKNPAAAKQQLTAAGLDPDDIKAIDSALAGGIDRSIHASLSLDLKELSSGEAAFLYTIELAKLNAAAAAAVTSALNGDLRAMATGAGVTVERSILTRTTQSGSTFRANFVGLFNFESLAAFVSKSEVLHEPASGDVVFVDTASAQHIGAIALPQAQEKLRRLYFDSLVMTTAYRSAGALESMDMECSAAHFATNGSTGERTMSEYLDWFVALRLLDAAGKAAILQTFHGTGASTCTARVAFSQDACQALFFDAGGEPLAASHYVALGRNALKQLSDADGYRREVLDSDRIWNRFDGQTTIRPVMEQEQGWQPDDPRVAVLSADYTAIEWWASAMSSTAGKVAEMRKFLRTADAAAIGTNKAFLAMKADLHKHMMSAIANSPLSFGQPFGLVALAYAAGPAAVASGILLSAAVSRRFGGRAA